MVSATSTAFYNLARDFARGICVGSLLFGLLLGGCDGDPAPPDGSNWQGPGTGPVFPIHELEGWTELRDCRHSHEHELRRIRVLVNDLARPSYEALDPSVPYPVDATLVKLEYDDPECTELLGYTAMRKMEPGSTPPYAHDWHWQRLDTDFRVTEEGSLPFCINCHAVHCDPAHATGGYDLTCAEEI